MLWSYKNKLTEKKGSRNGNYILFIYTFGTGVRSVNSLELDMVVGAQKQECRTGQIGFLMRQEGEWASKSW